MTVWAVLLCMYGALAFFCLGLVAAKGELLREPPVWRYMRSVLFAPLFVSSELRSFGRVRLKVRREHREDIISVLQQQITRYPGSPTGHVLYLLNLLDADPILCQHVLNALDAWARRQTRETMASCVQSASSPGRDIVEFVGYIAASAGMEPKEALQLTDRLIKCYQAKLYLPRVRDSLN